MMRPVLVSTNCLPGLPPRREPLRLRPVLAWAALAISFAALAFAHWGM